MSCKTCGHYELMKMITSGKPYGYSGEIPCIGCKYFSTQPSRHTSDD